jgi:hypothetical protein
LMRRSGACYVLGGYQGIHNAEYEARALEGKWTADELVRAEAEGLARIPDDRDIRLHEYGDCQTPDQARMLAEVAEARTSASWTFTHSWALIPRQAWGRISVLASVHTGLEVAKAAEQGYVPAVIVRRFPREGKAFELPGIKGWKWLPCRYETEGTTCVECRLCLDDGRLRRQGYGIAFKKHGR